MLIAMTYQVELFIATVAGLGIGHFLFNTAETSTQADLADPCCVPHEMEVPLLDADNLGLISPKVAETAERRTLLVRGMSCGHCVANIDRALRAVDGVDSVTVDLDSGAATVRGAASAAALVAAVEAAGFDAEVVSQAVTSLRVGGMTCGNCSAAVEKALRAVDGVTLAMVDLQAQLAHVRGTAPIDELIAAVEATGKSAAAFPSSRPTRAADSAPAGPSKSPAAEPEAEPIWLLVSDMTCNGCADKVHTTRVRTSWRIPRPSAPP